MVKRLVGEWAMGNGQKNFEYYMMLYSPFTIDH